jgi:aromatic ring hydroxylase
MSLRSGKDYIESIRRRKPEVWFEGERVDDVTEHPAFSRAVRTMARHYDLARDPEHEQLLTIPAAEGNARDYIAYMIPRSKDDVRQFADAAEFYAARTGGMFARGVETSGTLEAGAHLVIQAMTEGHPDWAENIARRFAEDRRASNYVVFAAVHPQVDRSRGQGEMPALRTTGKTASGLVVNGVKPVCTGAPYAEELWVGTLPAPGLEPEQSLFFSIPLSTPGVRVVARRSFTATAAGTPEHDHPLGRFGDEVDALISMEDVEVPWDRVFSYGEPEAGFLMPEIVQWDHLHLLVRLQVKAELMVGLANLVTSAIGTAEFPPVVDKVLEVVRYAETLRAFRMAAVAGASEHANGVFLPDLRAVAAGRAYAVEHHRTMLGILLDLSGQSLLMQMPSSTVDAPELHDMLVNVSRGHQVTAEEKAVIFRAVWDLVCDGFGSRQTLFENFNAGNLAIIKNLFLASRVDPSGPVAMAREVIGAG